MDSHYVTENALHSIYSFSVTTSWAAANTIDLIKAEWICWIFLEISYKLIFSTICETIRTYESLDKHTKGPPLDFLTRVRLFITRFTGSKAPSWVNFLFQSSKTVFASPKGSPLVFLALWDFLSFYSFSCSHLIPYVFLFISRSSSFHWVTL